MKTKKLKQDILNQSIGIPKLMNQRNQRKRGHFPIFEIGQGRPPPHPPPLLVARLDVGVRQFSNYIKVSQLLQSLAVINKVWQFGRQKITTV